MKALIVGMGIQGKKRKEILGKEFICSVDKYKKSDYDSIYKVPLDIYDTVFICVPDSEKLKIVEYCIKNKKHCLIEKPFLVKNTKILNKLDKLSKKNKVICYIAYNHRFEPGLLNIKKIMKSKKLGKIYKCRMFYGNGTSLLVKRSKWRDKGKGVITDIGSHLFNLCFFWFGKRIKNIKVSEISSFEYSSPDYANIIFRIDKITINLEMTLCMWKNSFNCDIIGSKGSLHMNSLCKWSDSIFTQRKRKYPSGYPSEKTIVYKKGDPTWKAEYLFFKKLIKSKKNISLDSEIVLNNCFSKIKN